MPFIQKLSVQNVRSHDAFIVEFTKNVTVITGPNGSGKTSLLESIYLALQGSSFKGGDADILKQNSPWWRIDVLHDDEAVRTIKYDPLKAYSRKQFTVDSKNTARLSPKYKHPVVLFEPEDLRLLNGSPTRRRQFIDRFISQINPLYSTTLHKYERSLKQRNNLLKKFPVDPDLLFPWDMALSETGAYIIEQRIAFIEQINNELETAYQAIAKKPDTIAIHYSHTLVGDVKQKLLQELHGRLERDKMTGSTSIGPHRHDVLFEINGSPALSTASRGEVRTILLALKFLEVDIIERLTGKKPLILLDDVFSELDITRQQSLSDTIREHQIIITSTHTVSDSGEYQHVTLT